MDFGRALAALRQGERVARRPWREEQFLYLVSGSTFMVNRPPLLGIYLQGTVINYLPHIDVRLVDGSCAVWSAAQIDILADDWLVVQGMP